MDRVQRVNRKFGIVFIIIFFLFSVSSAQAQQIEAVKSQEESFPNYIFKTLPKNLLLGTERSLWGWNLATLGIGAGVALTLSQTGADREIQEGVRGSIGDFQAIGNIAGNGFTIAGVVVSTYIIGRVIGDEKVIETGKAMIESQIITAVMTGIIKVSVGRTRPDKRVTVANLPTEAFPIIHLGGGGRFSSSFPSGHASGIFALASTIDTMYGHKIGIPLYMFAGFVGFSRISDNKHFLSDFLFGAALGTVVGRAVAKIHKKEDHCKLSILPYSDGSGGGLMLTLSW